MEGRIAALLITTLLNGTCDAAAQAARGELCPLAQPSPIASPDEADRSGAAIAAIDPETLASASLAPARDGVAELTLRSLGGDAGDDALGRLLAPLLAHSSERGDLKLLVHADPAAEPRITAFLTDHGLIYSRRRTDAGPPTLEFYRDLYRRPDPAPAAA